MIDATDTVVHSGLLGAQIRFLIRTGGVPEGHRIVRHHHVEPSFEQDVTAIAKQSVREYDAYAAIRREPW